MYGFLVSICNKNLIPEIKCLILNSGHRLLDKVERWVAIYLVSYLIYKRVQDYLIVRYLISEEI